MGWMPVWKEGGKRLGWTQQGSMSIHLTTYHILQVTQPIFWNSNLTGQSRILPRERVRTWMEVSVTLTNSHIDQRGIGIFLGLSIDKWGPSRSPIPKLDPVISWSDHLLFVIQSAGSRTYWSWERIQEKKCARLLKNYQQIIKGKKNFDFFWETILWEALWEKRTHVLMRRLKCYTHLLTSFRSYGLLSTPSCLFPFSLPLFILMILSLLLLSTSIS